MALRDLIFRATERVRRAVGARPRATDWKAWDLDPSERERLSLSASTDCAKLFYSHHGRIIHKWIHYLDIYDRHFAPFRGTAVKMLEIGVFKGGSLDLWRKFFGAQATIFGVDINPECAALVTPPNQVRTGSQADPEFLRSVVQEMGTPEIILDDGSHRAPHQRVSFDTLFPLLRDGGLYVIEDLHTSYSPGIFEGGYRRKGSAIERVKDMIDDMHAWYHPRATTTPARDQIYAIHVYDSIVILEKRKITRPAGIQIG
ncbi:MAG: class I SAM-dependent methyltransferase [Acidobacteriaceae bacterium]